MWNNILKVLWFFLIVFALCYDWNNIIAKDKYYPIITKSIAIDITNID